MPAVCQPQYQGVLHLISLQNAIFGELRRIVFCNTPAVRSATLECGARRACSRRAGESFSSAFKSHVSLYPALHCNKNKRGRPEVRLFLGARDPASRPEGSEHRAFSLRMAPGDVAHVPRPPSPVAKAGPVAKHFRSRARLCRLLVRLRRPTPHRSLRSLRSASSLSFLVTCRRQVMPSHSFAALTALVVRHVSGYGDRPLPCTS